MEYVGEVLDYRAFKSRTRRYARENCEHHYFMALSADEVIDAAKKGNVSRFINHCCDPNAETQKVGLLSCLLVLQSEPTTNLSCRVVVTLKDRARVLAASICIISTSLVWNCYVLLTTYSILGIGHLCIG